MVAERGFVMVTSLIFLLILTVIGVTAMMNTSNEQQITTNVTMRVRAQEGSDWSRGLINYVMGNHFFYRGWPSPMGGLAAGTFTIDPNTSASLAVRGTGATTPGCAVGPANPPAGHAACPCLVTADGTGAPLYDDKITAGYATSIIDYTCPDARISIDSNGDSTADLTSDVYIVHLGIFLPAGVATAQVAGYEGTGKGTAGGGAHIYLDIRSRGTEGTQTATAMTGIQYRIVIK